MNNPPPAAVGMTIDHVDTPALLIDLDALESNMKLMQDRMDQAGVRLRPHAKTHKCAPIAHRQIALGAVGICCQKVSEAEALVLAGVTDIMVTNQIVGTTKVERLAALSRSAKLSVCVDDAENVHELGTAARKLNTRLDVMVEIDVGAHRCGVAPGMDAVDLVKLIGDEKHLNFIGLQAYQGGAQHIRDFAERKAAIEQATDLTRDTLNALDKHGYSCQVVAGGGTGTHLFESTSGIYNEVQAGSYIFMDADYGKNLNQSGEYDREFKNSLFVLTSVMSRTRKDLAVVDAGLKSMSFESGLPEIFGYTDYRYDAASDEHGCLEVDTDSSLRVGDKLKLIPGHCDPTVNLHDWFVCTRKDLVEALWPVTARGAIW